MTITESYHPENCKPLCVYRNEQYWYLRKKLLGLITDTDNAFLFLHKNGQMWIPKSAVYLRLNAKGEPVTFIAGWFDYERKEKELLCTQ